MSQHPTSTNPPHSPSFDTIYVGPSTSVAIGASSTQSAKSSVNATLLYLCPTQPCLIAIGPNPTAHADGSGQSLYMPANVPQIFGCHPGDKVAVIEPSGGSAGTLYITEGA